MLNGVVWMMNKAWIIVEVENKEDAMYIIPPLYRATTKIVQLNTFTAKDILESEKYHKA